MTEADLAQSIVDHVWKADARARRLAHQTPNLPIREHTRVRHVLDHDGNGDGFLVLYNYYPVWQRYSSGWYRGEPLQTIVACYGALQCAWDALLVETTGEVDHADK